MSGCQKNGFEPSVVTNYPASLDEPSLLCSERVIIQIVLRISRILPCTAWNATDLWQIGVFAQNCIETRWDCCGGNQSVVIDLMVVALVCRRNAVGLAVSIKSRRVSPGFHVQG